MVVSKRDARRLQEKSIKKVNAKKRANPEAFMHETSEYSKFLAMEYDYKNGALNPYKLETYQELKKKYGGKK